jgi:hypothetical protein
MQAYNSIPKIDIMSLEKYMIHNVWEGLRANKNNICAPTPTSAPPQKLSAPNVKHKSNNIYVDYNKNQNKYNEKLKKYNFNKFADQFFWCFYQLSNDLNLEDLNYINPFKVEKDFKISLLEKIRVNKDIFKKYKIKKTAMEDDLLNNKYISLETFKGLCLLYKLNVLIFKDNNTYTYFSFANTEEDDDEEDEEDEEDDDEDSNSKSKSKYNFSKYNIIKLNFKNESILSKNFELTMYNWNDDKYKLTNSELASIAKEYYYLDNLEKPLKAFSSYKLGDLHEICSKLKINIMSDTSKKLPKQELFNAIMKQLS